MVSFTNQRLVRSASTAAVAVALGVSLSAGSVAPAQAAKLTNECGITNGQKAVLTAKQAASSASKSAASARETLNEASAKAKASSSAIVATTSAALTQATALLAAATVSEGTASARLKIAQDALVSPLPVFSAQEGAVRAASIAQQHASARHTKAKKAHAKNLKRTPKSAKGKQWKRAAVKRTRARVKSTWATLQESKGREAKAQEALRSVRAAERVTRKANVTRAVALQQAAVRAAQKAQQEFNTRQAAFVAAQKSVDATTASLVAAQSAASIAYGKATREAAQAEQVAARATEKYNNSPVVMWTQNLNFGVGEAKVKKSLGRLCALQADIVFAQEAKNVNLNRIAGTQMNVFHDVTDAATAGSAFTWRKSVSGVNETSRIGATKKLSLARGIDARALRIESTNRPPAVIDTTIAGKPTRLISVHYPPKRHSHAWPAMNTAVRNAIAARPKGSRWIVGGDFNQPVPDVARLMGGNAYNFSIDGFVTSKDVKVSKTRVDFTAEKNKWSDHPAYGIWVR